MKTRILTRLVSAICAVIVSTSYGIISVGAWSELPKEQQESMSEQLAMALQLEELGMSPESIIEAEMQKEGQAKELAAIAQADLYSNLAEKSVGAQSELTKEQQESMDKQLAAALQFEELGCGL